MSYNTILATAPLTQSGYYLRANGTSIDKSLIWDNGTNVGIGNQGTTYKLDVTGTGRFTDSTTLAGIYFTTNDTPQGSQGTITKHSVVGLVSRGVTGSVFDWSIYSAGGNALITNPTGTNNIGFNSGQVWFNGGNVGIGTSSPFGKFNVVAGTNLSLVVQDSGIADTIELSSYSTGGGLRPMLIGSSTLLFYTGASGGGSSAERMRITSGGYTKISNNASYTGLASPYHEIVSNTTNNASLIVSNQATSNPYGVYMLFTGASPNDITRWFWNCEDTTATRAYMRSNGGLVNYQANDTNLSDIRTKKDIISLESYWDKFKAIEIVKFKYKDQTHDDYNIGLIAQQLESIAPEFIDTDGWGKQDIENEEPLKSVYTSDLHHATIKVLQEAMAKIEELSKQNEELSNRLIKLESK
jgi:hypothetical protein